MNVLGVAAHPDDLEFGASGTFAKFAREGANCYYLICTNGCKGSNDPKMTEAKLIKIRQAEQRAAAKVIGLKNVFFLDHNDTELVVDQKLKKEIVRYIRKLKPDIVITSDPTMLYSKRGYVNHTDHRAAGLATMDAAYPLAQTRLVFKELEKEGLQPHNVKQLWLTNFDSGDEIVDISKTISIKEKALILHKSQVSKDALGWVKQMAKMAAKGTKYKFAERFVKLNMRG